MSRRYSFCRNWTSIFHKDVIILYCIVYSCFAQYTFTTQPEPVFVVEGQTASLTCEWIPQLNEGHKVKWIRLGYFEINSSDPKYNLTSELTISYLSIFPFHSSDIGSYRCDIAGIESNDMYAGTIACSPGNNDGELGTIPSCYISLPISTIYLYWYRNGVLINTQTQTENTLFLTALSSEDDGAVFTCNAVYVVSTNKVIGTCETTPLVLTIDATLEKTPPGPLEVGDSFNLTCSVNGNPDNYEYQWMYNNKVLYSSEDYSDKRFGIGAQENIFTFRSLTSSHIDITIKCIVSRLGRNSSSVSYIIELPDLTINLATTLMALGLVTNATSATSVTSNHDQDEFPTTVIVICVVLTMFVISIICLVTYLQKRRITKKNPTTSNLRSDNVKDEYDEIVLPSKRSSGIADNAKVEYDYAVLPRTRSTEVASGDLMKYENVVSPRTHSTDVVLPHSNSNVPTTKVSIGDVYDYAIFPGSRNTEIANEENIDVKHDDVARPPTITTGLASPDNTVKYDNCMLPCIQHTDIADITNNVDVQYDNVTLPHIRKTKMTNKHFNVKYKNVALPPTRATKMTSDNKAFKEENTEINTLYGQVY